MWENVHDFYLVFICLTGLNVSAVHEKRSPLSFPWKALPDSMKEKLGKDQKLSTSERRELRRTIGTHMAGTLKDFKRSTASSLINIFMNEYPGALKIVDADNEPLSDGKQAFLI